MKQFNQEGKPRTKKGEAFIWTVSTISTLLFSKQAKSKCPYPSVLILRLGQSLLRGSQQALCLTKINYNLVI